MDFCANCGEKLNESSQFCNHCHSRVEKAEKNITSTPTTRIEKRKVRSRNKRLVAGFGSVFGLALVFCGTYIITKDFNKHDTKTDAVAAKTIAQSENNNKKNNIVSNKGNHSTDKNSSKSSHLPSSDYILPDSDKKVLSEDDISTLTKGQLRLARNEIYARHGYVFQSADLKKYFSSKSWYHPNPSYNISLNEVERENVQLLKASENRLQ